MNGFDILFDSTFFESVFCVFFYLVNEMKIVIESEFVKWKKLTQK